MSKNLYCHIAYVLRGISGGKKEIKNMSDGGRCYGKKAAGKGALGVWGMGPH